MCGTFCLTFLADECLRQYFAISLDGCSFRHGRCGTIGAVWLMNGTLERHLHMYVCASHGHAPATKCELSGVTKALCDRDEEVGERLRCPAHQHKNCRQPALAATKAE